MTAGEGDRLRPRRQRADVRGRLADDAQRRRPRQEAADRLREVFVNMGVLSTLDSLEGFERWLHTKGPLAGEEARPMSISTPSRKYVVLIHESDPSNSASGGVTCAELRSISMKAMRPPGAMRSSSARKAAAGSFTCRRASAPAFALADVERADGRARRILVESFLGGKGADPMRLIEDERRMIALVVGEREEFASWDFMRAVTGPALWRGGALRIAGAGHAPFGDAPEEFNPLLLQFMRDAARRAYAPLADIPTSERRLTA